MNFLGLLLFVFYSVSLMAQPEIPDRIVDWSESGRNSTETETRAAQSLRSAEPIVVSVLKDGRLSRENLAEILPDWVDDGREEARVEPLVPQENYDFCPHARSEDGVNFINLYWLAALSEYAYLKPSVAGEYFRKLGFDEALFVRNRVGSSPSQFSPDVELYILKKKNTAELGATNNGYIIFLFRGSERNSQDWTTNLLFETKEIKALGKKAQLHSGFHQAFNTVWPELKKHVLPSEQEVPGLYSRKAPLEDSRPIWITGHSSGGALGQLLALRLITRRSPAQEALVARYDTRLRGIYTFASPRIGNKMVKYYLESHFNTNRGVLLRHRAVDDPVTKSPPTLMGYRHSGLEMNFHYRGIDEAYNRGSWECHSDWDHKGPDSSYKAFTKELEQSIGSHHMRNHFRVIEKILVSEHHGAIRQRYARCPSEIQSMMRWGSYYPRDVSWKALSRPLPVNSSKPMNQKWSACRYVMYEKEGLPVNHHPAPF